jgi:iron(III) transport system ATP-binding protein
MLQIEDLAKSYTKPKSRRAVARPSSIPEETSATARPFALRGVTFEVQAGEIFTLLGPSGCGKTTALRSIAGLERPDAGSIRLRDRVFFDSTKRINVPINKRGLGMGFQSYAIWPHMSVYRNVSFPLEALPKGRRPSGREIKQKVSSVLEIMELGSYADRQATTLSGGQQQRLALARAIVTNPPLVLLDEPLSNLDARLRDSMRFELKRLQQELGLTIVYVTHDQAEALVLSSRIAIMRDGDIVQLGRPRDVYDRPTSRFVAEFVGVSNVLTGVFGSREGQLVRVDTSEGALWARDETTRPPGSDAVLALRPERFELSTVKSTTSVRNEWKGVVVSRAFAGDSVEHLLEVGRVRLRVQCHPKISIPPGTDVYLTIAPEHVTVVPA